MPELPEVETVCRGLTPLLKGKSFTRIEVLRPTLRTPIPTDLAQRLTKQTVKNITRRAKYILITTSNDDVLLVHLGMTGAFFVRPQDTPLAKHDHIVFHLNDGKRIAFHDPRRFGQVDLMRAKDMAKHPSLAPLGPEPLSDEFTPIVLQSRLQGRKTSIKAALLDQHVVAGLGNIYVSEALFHARIHPEHPAGTLTHQQTAKLVPAIKQVLTTSLAAGGSTLRDYRHPTGELGFFQDQFAVYGRAGERCAGCRCTHAKTGGITRIIQGGRSTFFCPHKQVAPPP